MSNHFDVIIIGSGAGGGTLAQALAPSGKKILILERGDYLLPEKDNWNEEANFIDMKYKIKDKWYDKHGKSFYPNTCYAVGGNTKVYGAALFRMRQIDFEGASYPGGLSYPAWPIRYSDLEPYYLKAEQLYHVHGQRGEDPSEAHCDDPYPYPPVEHEPYVKELVAKLKNLGYKPFHLPVGIMLDEKNRHSSRGIKFDHFDGYPCMLEVKADAHTCCIKPALEYPNVTLRPNSYVEKLETDATGKKITKVIVKRDDKYEEYTGDIIVSSCGAINSAVLLLRSANEQHPTGLANSSGMVGRNYMGHIGGAQILAFSRKANLTEFQKAIGLHDFYSSSPDWPYPLGSIQSIGNIHPAMIRSKVPKFIPTRLLKYFTDRTVAFTVLMQDLPMPENRVMVDQDGRINLLYTDYNREGHESLVKQFRRILKKIGLYSLYEVGGIDGVGHQCGTLRFGHDPKNSVLDINCKTHDIDNLYVVDSSFFVSSLGVNPALTIMANALRVGDHLLKRLKEGREDL